MPPSPTTPPDAAPRDRRRPRWLWIVGIWLAISIVSANEWWLWFRFTNGRSVGWLALLKLTVPWPLLWGTLTPLILWLAHRFPVERQSWPRRLPLYAATILALNALDVTYDRAVRPLVQPAAEAAAGDGGARLSFAQGYVAQLEFNAACFLAIVLCAHVADYYRRLREREVSSARLQAQLTTAQLQILRLQLQPHFLFNTLNAISELVYQDPRRAERMIAYLGDLLRMSLDRGGRQRVPLREELEFLRAYLEIQRTRFRDRLEVSVDAPPETLDALVPSMLLQPLAENAIRHGLSRRAAAGRLAVAASVRDAGHTLELRIEDDGVGLRDSGAASAPDSSGVGLQNTRERLRHLYPGDHHFTVRDRLGGGVEVVISIPLDASEAPPSPSDGVLLVVGDRPTAYTDELGRSPTTTPISDSR